ncbi:spore germination protein [Paenibacillus doosanensis]|uniref:spore germination protein n=1 Tax=Paenibacillus doosanensis TaxID=1229154 RepID=UPI00218092C2|nr:spore germination protein [Paenibacillus doosanensis]MCS7460504.1 spore germination protein [Paenibacillus doosanensis]
MNNTSSLRLKQSIRSAFGNTSDFVYTEAFICGAKAEVCYLETLVDYDDTMNLILTHVPRQPDGGADPMQDLASSYLTRVCGSPEEAVQSIRDGLLVLLPEDGTGCLIVSPVPIENSRSITEAQTENPIQSSLDSFNEDLTTNLSLIRKKVNTEDLVIRTYRLGSDVRRDAALIYVEGQADPKAVELARQCLDEGQSADVYDIQGLLGVLKQPRFCPFPTYVSSELPSTAMHHLMEGRIVIMMDQFPFSLSFPSIVSDFWNVKTDKNQPRLFTYLYRMIRIVSLIVAVSMPGLYVVLNSVNPELLRIQLAVSITNSREGVPYPVLIELILMLLVIEMVIEASIRLPKSIGPTITMIGGIILGQAVVQARLVSYFLIIVVAASTIAHFTLGTYMNTVSIRIYKYVVIVFSALYGILGLMTSIVLLCFYMGTMTTFEVPYLSLSVKRGKSE